LNKGIIVAKFGGTSMANAEAIAKSAKLVALNGVSLIVVSATSGTTNNLVNLVTAVCAGQRPDANKILAEIAHKHKKIAGDLGADKTLLANLDEILEKLQMITRRPQPVAEHRLRVTDEILSFGELLSCVLIIAALNNQKIPTELIDAREIIKTDSHFGHATPLIDEIAGKAKQLLAPKLNKGIILVTQGFMGSSPDGQTTTLGRGGSDYSAALLAEALGADLLQIWTDVSGIASTDPRIVKNAQRIEQLTFQEAAELATAGAKILYPKTVTPLRRANIPIYVGNTFAPESGGTTISNHTDHRPLVRAIALKTNQCLLSLTNLEMAYQFGYLAKAFGVFAECKVSIDQISTSEISIAVVVENHALLNGSLVRRLEEMGEVSVEKGLSVISVVGNDVNNAPGLVQDIFGNLEGNSGRVSIRMICQGASQHNFCFLVEDQHGQGMVQMLHRAFIEEVDEHPEP